MMRFSTLLSLFLLLVFTQKIHGQCNWSVVGSGPASGTVSTSYNDIALTPADVPYIAYIDASLSSAVAVKTYSAGAWQAVGSLSTYSNSAYTSIAMDGNTPYVAFADGTNSRRLLVRKYSAGAWSTVGTAVSTGTANYVSLAVYNGVPYVAYVDVANSSKATVKTFSAGAWVTLGAAVSTGTASYTSLSIGNNGTPYLAYQDVSNGSLAIVKSYNGSAWVTIGGSVSTNAATETVIDVSYNNIPYVAFNASSYICTVKTFTAGSWQTVGTGTISNVYTDIALAVDGVGTPYLAYYDLGSGAYKTSVMKYNGSAWAYAGSAGISNAAPNDHGLVVAKTGTPYVTIGDGTAGAYVKKLGSLSAITTQPVSPTTCAGTNASVSIATNTTGVTYQWQTGSGANFSNVTNGTSYSGTGTSALTILSPGVAMGGNTYRNVVNDNCTNLISNTVTLTVNPLPAVSVNSPTICSGTSRALTASGAASYLWSTGGTNSVVVVSPTTTTQYTVTGTLSTGCSASAVATVATISSKNITGNVSSTAGAVSGNMILYRYRPVLGKWDSVAFTPFSSIYSFGPVDSSLYVVKAVPTATNVLVTYGNSAISWKGASTISHGCTNNATHNVQVIALSAIGSGAGRMSGRIVEGQGFGQKPSSPYSPLAPGNPIGGIIVKGGKNPGGNMFAQTVTSANGTYTLAGLPNNAAGEEYFILVDIPGLDTNGTYHRILSSGSNSYTNLDFTVDSARVNPTPSSATAMGTNTSPGAELSIFPNPARHHATLRYSLPEPGYVSIGIYNVVGQLLSRELSASEQAGGVYHRSLSLEALKPGLYFLKFQVGDREQVMQLLVGE